MNTKKMWYKDKLVNFVKQSDEAEEYAVIEFDGILEHILLEDLTPCAEEMFEELGYHNYQTKINKAIRTKMVSVQYGNHLMTFTNGVNGANVWNVPTTMDVKLHQAIHQQMLELKWINQ